MENKTRKTLIFKGKELFLDVSQYRNNMNLAIVAYTEEDTYGDITINLPGMWLEDNEGFINSYTKSGGLEKALIKKGIIKEIQGLHKYNYGEYDLVTFDLEKLKEYDPEGVKKYEQYIGEKRKELLAQKAAEEATLLPNLLMKYMEIRKEERKDWTRAGQNRGTSQDLKAVSEALSYLRQKGLSTVEDLEAFLESSGKSAADYRNQMKPKEARSKVIDGILASRTDCKECKPVYEKYQKIFFKKTKEKFKQEHPEVARYAKAAAYLAKHPDDKDSTQKELQEEQEKLLEEIAELKVPLTEVQEDLKKLRDIRYWVRKATPGTEEKIGRASCRERV